jgi:hypothetical protein
VSYPNYSASSKSQHATAGVSNSSNDVHEIRCINTILAGSNAPDGNCRVTAWNGNGSFDITIDDQFSAAITIHFTLYYGNDIYAMQTAVLTEPVAPGDVNMTFTRRPDYILIIGNASGALTTGISDDSRMMIGAASFRFGVIEQFVVSYGSNDNVNPTNTDSYNRRDRIIAHIDAGFGGGLTGQAGVTAIVGNTITFNFGTVSGSGARELIVLAITGGEWGVGFSDTVAAGNNINITGLGFLPESFVFDSVTQSSSGLGVTDSPDERVIGMVDSSGNQRSLTIEDSTGIAGDTRISMANQFDSIYATTNGAAGPAIDARVTFTSRNNNGAVLAQPLSDGTGRNIYHSAVGESQLSFRSLTAFL